MLLEMPEDPVLLILDALIMWYIGSAEISLDLWWGTGVFGSILAILFRVL